MRLVNLMLILGCCMLLAGHTNARRIARRQRNRHRKQTKIVPVLRALDEDYSEDIEEEEQPESPPMNTKLLLLNANTQESVGAGRTLKHFLLVKSLMRPEHNYGTGSGGGGGGGFGPGYIFINVPTNFTNVNNNTNVNGGTAATTTTGTGGTGAGGRIGYNYFGQPAAQALPMPIQMPMQMPTQVYQQRESSSQMPFNVMLPAAMISGFNGFNGGIIPMAMPMPMQMQMPPQNKNSGAKRRGNGQRRRGNDNNNNKNNANPFVSFANSWKRMQFL